MSFFDQMKGIASISKQAHCMRFCNIVIYQIETSKASDLRHCVFESVLSMLLNLGLSIKVKMNGTP